ncbi:E3 ubiquitin-protein ligase RNF185-like [Drosophila guanche]|uniref:Blast:TNF receptor-associated factor 6 n=1 Tax=Drosophila guanche TaxID=7266 RepID=A0A3B0JE44_DROGU|nr:E3 ubiquitin-protein ligase RNF185-like [Drosophila guanche]SPP78432.1 blast:TNF receptor-associated factor 6 [Drosophila guanche]
MTRRVLDIAPPADACNADITIDKATSSGDMVTLSVSPGAVEGPTSSAPAADQAINVSILHSNPLNVVPSGFLDADASSQNFGYECPICLMAAFDRSPVATTCGHIFCRECIEEQIRQRNKCAKCNMKITADQLVRLYL